MDIKNIGAIQNKKPVEQSNLTGKTENKQPFEIKKLQTLLDISSDMLKAGTYEEIGKIIYENLVKFKVGELFHSKLGIYDEEKDIYQLVFQTNFDDERFKISGIPNYKSFPINNIGYYSQVAVDQKRTLLITDNHSQLSMNIDARQKDLPEQTMVFIPLFYNKKFIGLFSLAQTPKNSIDEDFVVFLESILNYACIKIEELLNEDRRKEAERKVIENEERWQLALEGSGIGVWDLDVQKEEILFSKQYKETLGYLNGELPDQVKEWTKKVHPDDIKSVLENFMKHFNKVTDVFSCEYRFLCKDGSYKWVMDRGKVVSWSKDGKPIRMVGTHTDISERKLQEEELHKIKAVQQVILDNLPLSAWLKDTSGRFLAVNQQFANFVCQTKEEIIGKTDYDLWPYESAKRFINGDRKFIEEKKPISFEEKIFKNGKTYWHEIFMSPVFNDGGMVIANAGISRDITDRKLAEESLSEEKERLAVTLKSIGDGVITTDLEGKIVLINRVAEHLTGYHMDDAIGKNLTEVFNIIDRKTKEKIVDVLEKINTTGRITSMESHIVLISKEGAESIISDSGAPIRLKDSKIIGYVLVFRDITEKQRMTEEILKRQKLESVGLLAGGIAHDFNNILAIILGHTSLLGRNVNNTERLIKGIEAISKAGQRGAALIKQLLTFARKTETVFECIQVNDTIIEIKKLMEETFPKKILINTSLLNNLPRIYADANQIHQILLNLCVNARDAMPKGGNLTISTSTIMGDLLSIRFPKVIAKNYICIEVADSGTGMDEATCQRIFEPFFTTKEQGKGTGLGLALVFGIVASHDGIIDVYSEPGTGTIFSVFLPILDNRDPESESINNTIEDDTPGGNETILLVEDEENIRGFVVDLLKSKGYEVIIANDGFQGLELYRIHSDKISIILSDVGLPGLSGDDLLKRIHEINPDAKAIFASGFFDPEIRLQLSKYGVKHFLQKPYSLDEILWKIREAIDEDK
jgi:two-component system, cell cycle sensor histidine kinase and response regulator CckA